MNTKTINQTVTFKATPHEIYECLMDSEKHSEFSGAKAEISREVNGKFTAYDGWIEGSNVELIQDKKIVQKWRGSDWPEGHFSTATFELEESNGGTKLTFTQTDVPEENFKDISKGWHDHYWDKIKKTVEE